jgi:hypothetical protein
MPTKPKKTIAQQLRAISQAVHNSIECDEIRTAVAAFGYDQARLDQGRALYETASAATLQCVALNADKKHATAIRRTERVRARDAYQTLAQTARALFVKDRSRLRKIGLSGQMPERAATFITAARTLFDNIPEDPEIAATLARHGYDEEHIASERLKIAAFEQAIQAQHAAKGAAQHQTQVRDEALSEMNRWLAQYLAVARVALRDRRQLLVKIRLK